EAELLAGARLIQFMIGGVDFIPLGELPKGVPVATNGGGYAESMAEHALAMALAAAKRLILEHENLKLGQFNQFTQNRMLAGGVCGIFGFGGIGAAAGRLMHGIGMRVHAINRHGRTNERVDWIGTPERLNKLLEAADVLIISAPLTHATRGLIGPAELDRMKDDAILVNLARGEIVQERPLSDHLVQHPRFNRSAHRTYGTHDRPCISDGQRRADTQEGDQSATVVIRTLWTCFVRRARRLREISLLVFLSLFLPLEALAQSPASMNRIDLHDGWTVQTSRKVRAPGDAISTAKS